MWAPDSASSASSLNFTKQSFMDHFWLSLFLFKVHQIRQVELGFVTVQMGTLTVFCRFVPPLPPLKNRDNANTYPLQVTRLIMIIVNLESVSSSPGWPRTHKAKDNLELWILRLPPTKR